MVTSRLHVQNVRTEINHALTALHAQAERSLASVNSQSKGQGTLTTRSIKKDHAEPNYNAASLCEAPPTSTYGRLSTLFRASQGDGVATSICPAIPIATSRVLIHGPSTTPKGLPSVSSGCIATM
jgi:predicted negative regulator of RcsB-dependent stress response